MAKFLLDDGSTQTYDDIVYNKNKKSISPVLMTEIRLINALNDIASNLNRDEEINTKCINDLLYGEHNMCPSHKNCRKCISDWFFSNQRD